MGRDKEMRERNIYKDIVICIVIGWIIFFLYGQLQSYRREQKAYGFSIQSSRDLTQETVDELQKISGIYRFEPEEAVIITIKIGEYTMETEVFGVDLQDFPGKWKEGLETFSLGNTPVLFLGTDSFQRFTDRNGYGLGKSQADKWKQDYPNLNLTLEDDAGKERDGKICGILVSKNFHTASSYMDGLPENFLHLLFVHENFILRLLQNTADFPIPFFACIIFKR